MYVDYTSLFFAGADIRNIFCRANVFLEKLHDWTTTTSLTINISKAIAVLFHPKNVSITVVDEIPVLDSRRIKIISTVKTLGVIFHEHMQYYSHVCSIISKLSNVLGIFYKFFNLLPTKV